MNAPLLHSQVNSLHPCTVTMLQSDEHSASSRSGSRRRQAYHAVHSSLDAISTSSSSSDSGGSASRDAGMMAAQHVTLQDSEVDESQWCSGRGSGRGRGRGNEEDMARVQRWQLQRNATREVGHYG